MSQIEHIDGLVTLRVDQRDFDIAACLRQFAGDLVVGQASLPV